MRIQIAIISMICFTLFACSESKKSIVEIKKTDSGYQLYRNGAPFYIKGAGITGKYAMLKEYGGNSIRTWGITEWDEVFAQAEKYGLTVCAGLWLEQERQGFDYNDAEAVQKQFEGFKEAILKYKDHPSLLLWGIGNEMDLHYTNPKVWDAVEQVARFIKEVDGNHPTMTVTAFIEEEEVEYIKTKCPSIDILGVNAYAGLPVLSKFLENFGWDGAYVVGEWGPFGHWEVPKTSWNEPIEHTSKEKAERYLKAYEEYIKPEPNCLGAYVFLWGSKQERTPTWYSMFLPGGEKTQAVDVMRYCWKGEWPENKSPILDSLRLAGKKAVDNIIVKPDKSLSARVYVHDPENDPLRIDWEILYETTDKRAGGDEEEKPRVAKDILMVQENHSLTFSAPKEPGPYRLFVYVYDQKGSGAHANIPFFVEK